MNKLKYFLQQSWLVIAASFCFGLLIALADAAWSPRIQQNKIDKLNYLMTGLIPDAEGFQEVEKFQINSAKANPVQTTIYKAVSQAGRCIGWVFNAKGPGFADQIELVIAVDKNFDMFSGFAVLLSNETPGFGDKIKNSYYKNQFPGAPAGKLEIVKSGNPEKIDSEIVAITGATVSSRAIVDIINNTVTQVKNKMQKEGLIIDAE